MGLLDNLFGGTNYVEFDFNGKKAKINVKAHQHFTKALELYKENKITEAAIQIDECIKAEPNNQNIYYYKGYIMEDIPDYPSAIEAYGKSLQINPSQYWVSFRQGICYQMKHKYQEAINSFTEALVGFEPFLDPIVRFELKQEQIYTNRAISHANIGYSQQCLDDCTNAININSQYANSYFIRGLEYLKLNKEAEAEQDLKKAATLNHPKASAILAEKFPVHPDLFEKIKAYADSEQVKVNLGGQRPRDHYRNDILRYVNDNPLKTYDDLFNFGNMFLAEIWSAFHKQGKQVDTTNKAYIIYELTVAICGIYNSVEPKRLFTDLFK